MNVPTILLSMLIALIFVTIIVRGIQNRKQGKGSCSCGCSGCSMSELCHGEKQ